MPTLGRMTRRTLSSPGKVNYREPSVSLENSRAASITDRGTCDGRAIALKGEVATPMLGPMMSIAAYRRTAIDRRSSRGRAKTSRRLLRSRSGSWILSPLKSAKHNRTSRSCSTLWPNNRQKARCLGDAGRCRVSKPHLTIAPENRRFGRRSEAPTFL